MGEESDDITSILLEDAVKFHGHLGPFLILGLKAGLLSNKVLGKDYFKTRVIVETRLKPPYSCFIDGIQVATGCTMGKGNIEIRDGNPIYVRFVKNGRVLEMRLKKEVLEDLKGMRTEEDSRRKALEIICKPTNELFDIMER
ncbi:formylmethanofuran dehydrogenase [Candidatus Bathyarchaeota archaeon]|nr:formylmethanofuran dehydrogenase [Candidatus Bathyarchaeota archaeon]